MVMTTQLSPRERQYHGADNERSQEIQCARSPRPQDQLTHQPPQPPVTSEAEPSQHRLRARMHTLALGRVHAGGGARRVSDVAEQATIEQAR